MNEKNENKSKLSLSTMILIGLGLGIACGIFFGEYCGFLSIIGNAL
jgi:Na+/H+-dicarboxylate symporter